MRLKDGLIHIAFFVTTLFLNLSCVTNELDSCVEGTPAEISVFTSVNDNAGNIDERVASLRMMVFSGSGASATLVSNTLDNLSIGMSKVTHSITTGTRTIVFVANETSAAGTQLQAVVRLSDLNSVTFSSTAFDGDSAIPMYVQYNDVVVTKDVATGKAIISGGGTMVGNAWQIELVKLAIKLDIILTSGEDITSNFNGVTISNLPSYVPLIPSVMYDNTSPAGANVTVPLSEFIMSYSAQAGWKAQSKATTRIVLPSKVFASVNQSTDLLHAMVLTANMNVGSSPSGPIGAAIPNDYTLPRNNNYEVLAKVQFPLLINVDVMDWTGQSIDNNVGRSLLLSAVNVDITERVRARVTFTSNQKFVYVDPSSANIADFDGISGSTGNTNFNYTYNSVTGSGAGYIDIYSATLSATKTSKITITANSSGTGVGLSREITINFTKTDAASNAYDDFVGAFWKASQRGERIIYNPTSTTNSWRAEVEDPTGVGSFVVLSTTFSYDPNLFTDRASDAEQFPVNDGVKTVAGTGRLYFRIGLTGYGSATTPRYARVKVTPDILQPASVKYIYVRQGEAADYLMRPDEPTTTLSKRDFAVKFSPYNMTAPVMSPGGTNVADHPSMDSHSGAFTQYPSQAGAFVNWINSNTANIRKAYHPLNASGALTGWAYANPGAIISGFTQYWGQSYIYETCPPGYRRPENGDIFNPVTTTDPASSEMLQSLLYNPIAAGNTDNSLYGYLADGFFDRRLPVVSLNNTELSAVSATTKDVAYLGRLFYNPVTKASLFFPLSGLRSSVDGSLAGAGATGTYWTGSASSVSNAWNFQFSKSSVVPNDATSRGFGYNLRCVADNGLKILSFSDNGPYGSSGLTAEKQMFVTDRLVNYGSHGTYPAIDNVRYYANPVPSTPITYAQIANFEGLIIIAYPNYLYITDTQIDMIADRIISGKLAMIYQVDGPSGTPSTPPAIITPYGADVRIMARLLGKSSSTFNQIFSTTDSPITTLNTFAITANSATHRLVNGPFGTVPYGSLVTMYSANSYPLAMAAGVQESAYPDMVVLARKNLADTKDNIMIAAHRKYPFVLMRNGCTLGENEGYSTTNKQLLRPLWLNFAAWAFEYKKSMEL